MLLKTSSDQLDSGLRWWHHLHLSLFRLRSTNFAALQVNDPFPISLCFSSFLPVFLLLLPLSCRTERWQTLQRPALRVHPPGVSPRPTSGWQPTARCRVPKECPEPSKVWTFRQENHVHALAKPARLLHLHPPPTIHWRLPNLQAGPRLWGGRVRDPSLVYLLWIFSLLLFHDIK